MYRTFKFADGSLVMAGLQSDGWWVVGKKDGLTWGRAHGETRLQAFQTWRKQVDPTRRKPVDFNELVDFFAEEDQILGKADPDHVTAEIAASAARNTQYTDIISLEMYDTENGWYIEKMSREEAIARGFIVPEADEVDEADEAEQELNALLGDDEFVYDSERHVWFLCGTTTDGLGWETDNFTAPSREEAIRAAIEYLEALEEDAELQEVIDRAAAEEQQRQREADAVIAEKELALSYDGVRLLTVEEAASQKGCHPETVRRALRAGQLSAAQKIGNIWLLDAREIASWEPRPVGRPSQDQRVESLIAAIEAANGGVFPPIFEVLLVVEGEWVTFNTHSLTGDNFAISVSSEGRKSNFRYHLAQRGPYFTRRLLISDGFPPIEGVEIGGFDYWTARCLEATVKGAEAELKTDRFISSLADVHREGTDIIIVPHNPECPPVVVKRTRWEWVAGMKRLAYVDDLINFVVAHLDDCGVRAAEMAAVQAALEDKYGEIEQDGDTLSVSTPEGRKTFTRRFPHSVWHGWDVSQQSGYLMFVPQEEILSYIKNL